MSHRLLGVVLCGGRSSRMGRDKSTILRPDGLTFLDHAIERISRLTEHVVVAGSVTATRTNVTVMPDEVPFQGPVSGVVGALGLAHDQAYDGCLVTPVDMPHLSASHLSTLVDQWGSDAGQIVCAVTEKDHRIQPLVAIYPVCLRASLSELATSADRSLHRWIASQQHMNVTLPRASCHNVNTPEDLQSGPEISV